MLLLYSPRRNNPPCGRCGSKSYGRRTREPWLSSRTGKAFGGVVQRDRSGSNDIVEAKVTNDTENLYFYVRCAADISEFNTDNSWMQLFVNTNNTATDGWYGYDFLINAAAKSADKTTSVSLGDYITYTITIKNNSNNIINNISVKDVVPNYTSFSEMSRKYYYNNDGSNIIWNIPKIEPKQTIDLTYKVKVTNNTNKIGKIISSTGKVGHLELNTLNLSISSLSTEQLDDFIELSLEYYNNKNVYYDGNANNSTNDPTFDVVTFNNDAGFVSTLYNRYYSSLGKNVNLTSELSALTSENFMNNIITDKGKFVSTSKLYKMMVNGGYGGTVFKEDLTMDRMRTVKAEYLLPGDIISFKYNQKTCQYIYLGDITYKYSKYDNAILLFTQNEGVKLMYGYETDSLLESLIGYNRFAIIRPSLYI